MSLKEEKIRDRKVRNSATLLQALQQMDRLDGKLLLVVDENDRFRGLISVGDVQRSLIRDQKLDHRVDEVMREKLKLARKGDSPGEIRETMLHFRTEFMPVLDEDDNLSDVIFWEDVAGDELLVPHEPLDIPVVVMAGGKGTRLQPITHVIPKPLVPLGNKTMIEHVIDSFYSYGCREFYLTVNYKAKMIEEYLEEKSSGQLKIDYVREDRFLGTAGSLKLLEKKLTGTFIVSNCDILVDQHFDEVLEYHRENGNTITTIAAIKNYHIPYGTLEVSADGLLEGSQEKPDMTFWVNTGVYILEPGVLRDIPTNEFYHITDLMDKVRMSGRKVGVFPVSEGKWRDVGDWSEYVRNRGRFGK